VIFDPFSSFQVPFFFIYSQLIIFLVQRLGKYELLVNKILQNTSDNESEVNALENAIEEVKKINQQINDTTPSPISLKKV